MMIKNYFWVALMVMCAITLNMYGQNEDLRQKYNRLPVWTGSRSCANCWQAGIMRVWRTLM